jgi:serine/threonine protein kinase
VLGRIGKGGFSKVYKVSNLLDKNTYALKKIELKAKDIKDSLDRNIERVQREARYLARLSHPKIIRYFNSWVEVI